MPLHRAFFLTFLTAKYLIASRLNATALLPLVFTTTEIAVLNFTGSQVALKIL